jgi:pilus assembly protein CpaE
MDTNLHILVVGKSPGLRAEFDSAIQGVSNYRCVTVYAETFRQAEELARNRRPHLICVEMNGELRGLKEFTLDVSQMLPETAIAGLYKPDQFESDQSESAFILEGVRARIQDFLRHPLSSTEIRQVFDRVFVQGKPKSGSSSLGHIVSFVSNKGGVGKSTISVNMACLLASRHPGQVLLVDASLQLGIDAMMLDLNPRTTIVDAVQEKGRLDETMLRELTLSHSCGLALLAAPGDAAEASEIDEESMYRILNLARRTYKYVLVDTFPMLDSVVMTVLDLSSLAFIIMQGTAPNVIGTAKLLPILDGLGCPVERQRLVLNQNYRNFAGNLTQPEIEERLMREFDYVFPYQKKLLTSANLGEPYILRASRYFGFGRSAHLLVGEIEQLSDRAVKAEIDHLAKMMNEGSA